MWGFFSWKKKQKRPPPHKELGLSNLYAGDPFNSLCGYSLCAFFALEWYYITHIVFVFLVDVADIFYFLRLGGGGGGGVRGATKGAGGRFFIENPRRGGGVYA